MMTNQKKPCDCKPVEVNGETIHELTCAMFDKLPIGAVMPRAPRYVSKPSGSVPTTWELATYDVWGNAKDGYEVNDVYRQGEIEMRIPQTRHNIGTPMEFISAYPTLRQIKRVVGIDPRCRIETQGDDLFITVNRTRDGYPLCELRCTSHESLSPVRKAEVSA